jgi:ribonuclease BN (tRNA processing enzyme)
LKSKAQAEGTFEVIPLGTGNFFSTRRFCTSLVLCAGRDMILVDCPDPFFRICARASRKSGRSIDPAGLDDVVLTHMHGDHSNGLEGFGFWRKFHNGSGRKPRIHTSHAVAGVLWSKLSAAMAGGKMPGDLQSDPYDLSTFFELSPHEFGETFEVRGVKFETRRTIHSIPCFGFRATFAGRMFGYSCDTAFDPALIDFLSPCDLIFHETDEGIHTPLERLEELPRDLRGKMRLVHLNDQFAGSRAIRAAKEGKIYRI